MTRTFLRAAVVMMALAIILPTALFASGQNEKPKATFFWALYDGLTEDFRAELETAFNKASPDMAIQIVPVKWDDMQNKLTTSLAGGAPPDISVVGVRWILGYMDTNSVEDISKYVSKSTIDNIAPGAWEAKIKGKLMGVPVAAGARFMAMNTDLAKKVPATMEELRDEAIKITVPGQSYGLIMPGKKHTELTDFCYYFYAAGGDFFATNADGSYGKSTVNSEAGVKALSFMVDLATKDKVVQDGFTAMTRMDSHPVFYAGKAGYVMIGAWVESAMKQAGSTFKAQYVQIPGFAGHKSTPLIITDAIAFFSKGKNLKAAGKFIDFFYQDQWKGKFDELVGFPPVTMSTAKLPHWQTPLYKAMGEAAVNAKPYPLVAEWDECNNIVWDACEKAFQGQATPKEALDEAAAKIDKARGL